MIYRISNSATAKGRIRKEKKSLFVTSKQKLDANVSTNIQPAATKVTDMAYLSFRERPVEFIKKEPDDKPGYVMNDHLSNSAVASSF